MEHTDQLQAFKYSTTVLKNGMIKIPKFEKYVDQEIEVIVVLKPERNRKPKKSTVDDFLEKWAGVFSEVETDDLKYKYLMEKIR
ncbi:MAG: hypothetical protein K9H64_22420 [Bacteroidales bacterium]|nr:hypothetical protein [Bacteroidales bacterium]MCF8458797.1 hypothetical protein [Bacteroidales bacterium]